MVTLERKSRSELSSIHLISLAETICLDGAPAKITSVSTRYTFQRSAERNPPPRRLGRSRFVTGAAINNLPNEGTRESRFHSLYPTSTAWGLPCRVITLACPRTASSTAADRVAFASRNWSCFVLMVLVTTVVILGPGHRTCNSAS